MKKEILFKKQNFDIYSQNYSPDIDCEIDLVMLSYNGLKTTREFMRCLLSNTSDEYLKKIRLVWTDNGSEDGTFPYLKNKFSKIDKAILINLNNNIGVIKGRNMGIFIRNAINSKSKYIMFLDNDQYVQEGWIEQHISILENGNYDLVGVEAWQMNNRYLPIKKLDNDIKNFHTYFHYVGCGGMLFKSELLKTVGFLNDEFGKAYFEDPDYCFRVIKEGYNVGWNLDAKIIHYPHQTLGNVNNIEKQKIFINSMKTFQKLWKGHKIKSITMNDKSIFK